MNMNLGERLALDFIDVNAEHQMTVHGSGIESALLFTGKIPTSVEPVRIARGEEQSLGAVSFGQLGGFGRAGMRWWWRGTKGVTLAGAAGSGCGGGLIAFEKNGRNRNFGRRLGILDAVFLFCLGRAGLGGLLGGGCGLGGSAIFAT